jgi:dTDP-4-dehydrorhamnose 3,5-epimerase
MNTRFDILETLLPGLCVLERKPIYDNRGCFERMFCIDDLQLIIGQRGIVQVNHTVTHSKGTVRGMHYQDGPHAEMKLVSCQRGSIFDVAVDLRKESPTFLSWHAEVLTANNHKTLVIPEGFAHGFQSLTDECELLYLHTAPYASDAERGLNPFDPRLAINWPLPFFKLSQRDAEHPLVSEDFQGAVQ